MKKAKLLMSVLPALVLAMGVMFSATGHAAPPPGTPPNPTGPQIYVTGQDLVYNTVVLFDLPMVGPFQKLEMAGPTGLQTEFGPGDLDFVGGRWWVDANGNMVMDEEDVFFMCPLLGPGYEL
jgi:hypothetical protein